jgi:membrane-bound metal-dependent hydrolase YbcI (DUF457 family)
MSLYKGHLAGGVFAFVIYLVVLAVFFSYKPTFETLIWFGLCILGSIWPDIDTSSTAQKLFYGFFLVLDVIFLIAGQYKKAAILGFFALLPIIGKHRGWTHSISAAFIIPSPLIVLPVIKPELNAGGLEYYIPVVIGYLSHLALDKEFKLF